MSFSIAQTSEFEKEAKFLSKKYSSFKNDLAELAGSLLENPLQGTPLGTTSTKFGLPSKAKARGRAAAPD